MSWDDFFGSAIDAVGAKAITGGTFEPIRVPVTLHPPQQAFFDDDRKSLFYGGSAGSGKTYAQAASALKHMHVPGVSAVLIRESATHLNLPGGFVDVLREWLAGTAAVWRQQTMTWRFPSGAQLVLGHAGDENALNKLQGATFTSIHVDEAGQFPERRLRWLYSRLRRPEGVDAPVRMRLSGNPGGPGHQFLKETFVDADETEDSKFYPALVYDNPSLDIEGYVASLDHLDPLQRARYLHGDWSAMAGGMFKPSWFKIIPAHQAPRGGLWVRAWDMAATSDVTARDPDYTAGALMSRHRDTYYLHDVDAFRLDPAEVEARIRRTAELDTRRVKVVLEQEGGSAGKVVLSQFERHILSGFKVEGFRPTKDKCTRATPVANAAASGRLVLIEGHWVEKFIEQAAGFPHLKHDDEVDAVSMAFSVLSQKRSGGARWLNVRGL